MSTVKQEYKEGVPPELSFLIGSTLEEINPIGELVKELDTFYREKYQDINTYLSNLHLRLKTSDSEQLKYLAILGEMQGKILELKKNVQKHTLELRSAPNENGSKKALEKVLEQKQQVLENKLKEFETHVNRKNVRAWGETVVRFIQGMLVVGSVAAVVAGSLFSETIQQLINAGVSQSVAAILSIVIPVVVSVAIAIATVVASVKFFYPAYNAVYLEPLPQQEKRYVNVRPATSSITASLQATPQNNNNAQLTSTVTLPPPSTTTTTTTTGVLSSNHSFHARKSSAIVAAPASGTPNNPSINSSQ